eukprot:6442050-Alexandrium_andersonii.AAC.1
MTPDGRRAAISIGLALMKALYDIPARRARMTPLSHSELPGACRQQRAARRKPENPGPDAASPGRLAGTRSPQESGPSCTSHPDVAGRSSKP